MLTTSILLIERSYATKEVENQGQKLQVVISDRFLRSLSCEHCIGAGVDESIGYPLCRLIGWASVN